MRVPRDEVRFTTHSDEVSAWGDDNSRAYLTERCHLTRTHCLWENVHAGLADIATTLEPTKKKTTLEMPAVMIPHRVRTG